MERAILPEFAVYVLLAAALLGAGCTPEAYRKEADSVAGNIITREQKQALGKTEPFTIETPAETLRRRLLRNQDLPISHVGSVGTDKLTKIMNWPEDYPKRTDPPKNGKTGKVQSCPTTQPARKGQKDVICLTMIDALQVAAQNNRDYQNQKESVYQTALNLDLEDQEFRNTFAGTLATTFTHDETNNGPVGGVVGSGDASWSRKLKTGASITASIGIDLVRMLTGDRHSANGLFADATVTIPLMRGSGRQVVTEPLTQSQRNVIYAIWGFERFKRTLAVNVASEYLQVLQLRDRVTNARDNYRRLRISAERAKALAEAGRVKSIGVDQAKQDELTAKDTWIRSVDTYKNRLDSFKLTLGLPTDARIELDHDELTKLANRAGKALAAAPAPTSQAAATDSDDPFEVPVVTQAAGKFELPEDEAIKLALTNRLDLSTTAGRVYDSQRNVVVAADALRADLGISATAGYGGGNSTGGVDTANPRLRPERGRYSLQILSDLPWERTAERNAYRNSYITLERATRDLQEQEDKIKLSIRRSLRTLQQAKQSAIIQTNAVTLAEQRVDSTQMFIKAGRTEMRDLLDAEGSLVTAKNAQVAALVSYRIAELSLQRDMGVLQVNEKGLWREYEPKQPAKR